MDKEQFNASSSNISPGGLLVRKHYCIRMRRRGKRDYGAYVIPQYDSGQSSDGRCYRKNVWDSIYKFLCDNELDVGEYVAYAFDTSRAINTPQALKNPELVDRFKAYKLSEEKPLLWEMEVNKILTEFMFKSSIYPDDLIKAYSCVLLDENIQVSTLTRYSYGVANGMEFLVRPLEEEAFKQYYDRRYFYDRYYKDNIPDNLRQKAVDLDGAC